MPPKRLSTKYACRIARLDRQRFNEFVAAGHFPCAPETIPGRARYFDPDDMVTLWLFRELMEDGYNPAMAGHIACVVGHAARQNPTARAISFVRNYFGWGGTAMASEAIPSASEWDNAILGGTDIRSVTTFRIGKLREMIAHYTEEELSYVGDDD